jgi:adenylyltransferase/sulfurtransferase
MFPFIIGSLQATEAIKILVGAGEANRKLNYIDVWVSGGIFDAFEVNPSKSCPACHGNYEFLEGGFSSTTTMLCGQNSVQLINPGVENISLKELEERLKPLGETACSEFMLRFIIDEFEMVVFPDGRAIVKNTTDESTARSLYAKYVGR